MSSPATTSGRATSPRLPPDTSIGRVRLRVADLQRALGFYREVLGLELRAETGNTVALGPAGPGSRDLIVLEERPGIERRPQRPLTAGLYHVALLVPSRPELGRTLLGLQAARYPLRGMSDHAVSESLYLDDPDGNGFEIYADRPRELWPVRDGVIQMTVEPMDVEGVMAAAREQPEPWPGLHPGTVVGHLHFTVSRMDPAVSFYRDVAGFDEMMRIPSLTAVSAGGYHHHINLNTWAGEGAPGDSEKTAGLVSWELRVPGAEARGQLLQRLARASSLESDETARGPEGSLIEVRA